MHYLSYSALARSNFHPKTEVLTGNSQTASNEFAVSSPNPFPPVDTKLLNVSADKFQELMKQANLLVTKISTSTEFAQELMSEAQQSNTSQVKKLILSTGITIKVETSFTPTGIHIKFDNSDMPGRCCQLVMALQW